MCPREDDDQTRPPPAFGAAIERAFDVWPVAPSGTPVDWDSIPLEHEFWDHLRRAFSVIDGTRRPHETTPAPKSSAAKPSAAQPSAAKPSAAQLSTPIDHKQRIVASLAAIQITDGVYPRAPRSRRHGEARPIEGFLDLLMRGRSGTDALRELDSDYATLGSAKQLLLWCCVQRSVRPGDKLINSYRALGRHQLTADEKWDLVVGAGGIISNSREVHRLLRTQGTALLAMFDKVVVRLKADAEAGLINMPAGTALP